LRGGYQSSSSRGGYQSSSSRGGHQNSTIRGGQKKSFSTGSNGGFYSNHGGHQQHMHSGSKRGGSHSFPSSSQGGGYVGRGRGSYNNNSQKVDPGQAANSYPVHTQYPQPSYQAYSATVPKPQTQTTYPSTAYPSAYNAPIINYQPASPQQVPTPYATPTPGLAAPSPYTNKRSYGASVGYVQSPYSNHQNKQPRY
jgi:hypothetical protein